MIWDERAFDLVKRTMLANKLHPAEYQFILVPGYFDSDGKDYDHRHVCGPAHVRNTVTCKCDNFPWHATVPTEELIFHGQCDDCRKVFVLCRADADDTTFVEFCENLVRHQKRKRKT